MTNEIIQNEIREIQSDFSEKYQSLDERYDFYVVRNHCVFADYLLAMLRGNVSNVFLVSGGGEPNRKIMPDDCGFEIVSSKFIKVKHAVCFYVVNCLDERYRDKRVRHQEEENLFNFCQNFTEGSTRLICCMLVPAPVCPEGITELAEREYDTYLCGKSLTWEETFYLSLERIVRTQVRDHHARIDLIRYDNIFGPDCCHLTQSMNVAQMFDTAVTNGCVTLTQADSQNSFTLLGVRDAASAAVTPLFKSISPGQVYNASGVLCTEMSIKISFYQQFPSRLALQAEDILPKKQECHGLSNLKLNHLGWKITEEPAEICYRLGCYSFRIPYDTQRLLPVYNGRLDRIKQLEMRMLRFVDQVCKKYGIQYFLAGGSLLGAVRNGGFIPWDDDLDIGMLREDFEVFRRVCPKLMPDDMTYEDANGASGSHYHFDKIRLKGTYFSTNYSARFSINDGVFLDILIYDQTSNFALAQTIQIRLISILTQLINIKWCNEPKKPHYIFSVLALPFLRLIPWKFFHRLFERVTRFYEKKPNAKFVIDSMGQNIKRGALRKKWMTKVVYVSFGDMTVPIPADYEHYLAHIYGSDYMENRPISLRISGHKIARLDLGPYLFDEDHRGKVRNIDLRGELFEKEPKQD